MEKEIPIMKLFLQLHPEVLAMLRRLVLQLFAMESECKKIRRSFAEDLNKLFIISEDPAGLGEAVVSELNPGPAAAGD